MTDERPIRRPGSPWRLLVHEYVGKQPDGTLYSTSWDVSNDARNVQHGEYKDGYVLPARCEFDELVVGKWLHIEQMDAGSWWMDVGGLVVRLFVDRDGRPKAVTYGVEDPIDGVTYDRDGE
jgi:hypothetical protein